MAPFLNHCDQVLCHILRDRVALPGIVQNNLRAMIALHHEHRLASWLGNCARLVDEIFSANVRDVGLYLSLRDTHLLFFHFLNIIKRI